MKMKRVLWAFPPPVSAQAPDRQKMSRSELQEIQSLESMETLAEFSCLLPSCLSLRLMLNLLLNPVSHNELNQWIWFEHFELKLVSLRKGSQLFVSDNIRLHFMSIITAVTHFLRLSSFFFFFCKSVFRHTDELLWNVNMKSKSVPFILEFNTCYVVSCWL